MGIWSVRRRSRCRRRDDGECGRDGDGDGDDDCASLIVAVVVEVNDEERSASNEETARWDVNTNAEIERNESRRCVKRSGWLATGVVRRGGM